MVLEIRTCYSLPSGGTGVALGKILMITSYLIFNISLALLGKGKGEVEMQVQNIFEL